MLQIKINGVWTDYKKAYMQNLTIFADGEFRNGFAIGDNTNYANQTFKNPLTYVDSTLSTIMPNVSERCNSGSYFSKTIDVTNYSTLSMTCTYAGTSYNLNIAVSSDTGSYYVCALVSSGYNSGYYYAPLLLINADKSNTAYKTDQPSGYIRQTGTMVIESIILS